MNNSRIKYGLIVLASIIATILFIITAIIMVKHIADEKSELPSSVEEFDEFEIRSFNNQFEALDGEQFAPKTKQMLSRVSEHNKGAMEERLITVTFLDKTTNNPVLIDAYTEKVEDSKAYLLTLDYSENGLVSYVRIELLK